MEKRFTKVIGLHTILSLFAFLFANITIAQDYCASSGTTPQNHHITNVTFSGIENNSGSSGYSNFTDMTSYVVPGISFPFSAKIGATGTTVHTLSVFIDWNQDGVFSSDERYDLGSCSGTNCANTGISGDIAVPHAALSGQTRMRVISHMTSNVNSPCGTFTYGEVEDYTVDVATGECMPPEFEYFITENCETNTFNVSALLNDFGTNNFITISMTRSDEVNVFPVTISSFLPPGFEFTIIENVPTGVVVDADILTINPICSTTESWTAAECPLPGEVCEAPWVISSLPFNASGNTSDYGSAYTNTDVPPLAPGAITDGTGSDYYITGDEVVFAYTPLMDEVLYINTTNNDDWIGLWVFTGCPFTATVGYHTATSGATRSIEGLSVSGGETYYIVISTWAAPQSTSFTINITTKRAIFQIG